MKSALSEAELYLKALERWHDMAGSIFDDTQILLERAHLDALEAASGDRIRRAAARLLPRVSSLADEIMGEMEQVIPRVRAAADREVAARKEQSAQNRSKRVRSPVVSKLSKPGKG
jgi:hypothetical protein